MQYGQLWLETQTQDGTEGKCLAVKLGSEVSALSKPMRIALERSTGRIIELIAERIREVREKGPLRSSQVLLVL